VHAAKSAGQGGRRVLQRGPQQWRGHQLVEASEVRKHSRTEAESEAEVEVEPTDANTQATLCLEKGTKQD